MYTALAAATLLTLSGYVHAQATAAQVAVVDAQFVNSGLSNPVPQGFGLNLTAQALLTVQYGSTTIQNGNAYTVSQVSDQPTVRVLPTSDLVPTLSSGTANFTLMLADASSLGDPDTQGNYRHYLANSVQATGYDSSGVSLSNGSVITYYAAPGPIAGTGPHRYAWMLFTQSSSFSAPSGLSTQGVSPSHWSVSDYVSQAGGLQLVAASFFTVENGTPTGSVASTAAVNTATLSVSSAAASGSGVSSTSAPTASPSQSSTSTKNPAQRIVASLSSVASFFVISLLAL